MNESFEDLKDMVEALQEQFEQLQEEVDVLKFDNASLEDQIFVEKMTNTLLASQLVDSKHLHEDVVPARWQIYRNAVLQTHGQDFVDLMDDRMNELRNICTKPPHIDLG